MCTYPLNGSVYSTENKRPANQQHECLEEITNCPRRYIEVGHFHAREYLFIARIMQLLAHPFEHVYTVDLE
jgi:hypothetical protein